MRHSKLIQVGSTTLKLSNPNQLDMFVQRDLVIWAAGFVDGEGCVNISRGIARDRWVTYQMCFIVAQRTREPLDILMSLFGGRIRTAGKPEHVHYEWRLNSQKAMEALKELLPYLIVKRQIAELAIRFQEQLNAWRKKYGMKYPEEAKAVRDVMFLEARRLNLRHGVNPEAPSYEELINVTKGVNGTELLQ